MKSIPCPPKPHSPLRRGYTLVELLVAVTLVLLMMTMFAQIFATATGALATQRGIAENDQRARRLQTTLTSDLTRRTYRALPNAVGIEPLLPNVAPFAGLPEPDDALQRGYFYYAENDPNNDTDDSLQFTMQAFGPQNWTESDIPPFVGRALFFPNGDPATQLDQPEVDDGYLEQNTTTGALQVIENSRGASQFAEVVYFLRHGNLYRRTLLVRQPFAAPTSPGIPELNGGNYGGPNTFWNDFDYSAFFDNGAGAITLLTQDALTNLTIANGGQPISLGVPKFRFGFWGDYTVAESGMPREFSDAAETNFIGRFTQEETSNPNFLYPGFAVDPDTATGNPHMDRAVGLTYDATRGVVSNGSGAVPDPLELAGGSRRSEDIVLSNVHSFDVEIFDPELSEFVDLGHLRVDGTGNPIGAFRRTKIVNLGGDGAGQDTFDDDGDGNDDNPEEAGWPGTNDYGNRWDTWHRDSTIIGNLQSPYSEVTDGPDGQPGIAGIDDDGANGIDDPGEQGWPGSDDVAPMRAIRIKIRYLDVSSNQMRDLTIIHSFADRDQ